MSDQRFRYLLVNILTLSRVPLIAAWMVLAVFVQLHFPDGHNLCLEIIAGTCMGLSGVTDLFDGLLARKWKVVSLFGKMADPLMDKVFYLVVFPTLTWQIAMRGEILHSVVMLVFTVLYILRDQWVTFLRSIGAYFHADVGAMWLGKFRTAVSFPCAGFIYAYLSLAHYFTENAMPDAERIWLYAVYAIEAMLIAVNIWSMFSYTRHYSSFMREAVKPMKNEGR